MRQIVIPVLLVAMCTGSMASVIWVLNFGGFNLLLLAGGCIAAVSTVVLAEEFVQWHSRTRGKVRSIAGPDRLSGMTQGLSPFAPVIPLCSGTRVDSVSPHTGNFSIESRAAN
jgi:hypothetical protein